MLNTIKMLFTVPFRILCFMIDNSLTYALGAGTRFIFKACFKVTRFIFMNPLTVGIILGGISTYILVDEDRRKKVLGMVGL